MTIQSRNNRTRSNLPLSQRRRESGGGTRLDLFSGGTFTRSTSGSYHNGSTSTLAWANPNVRRTENRGDFDGLLLEGSRTNLWSGYNGVPGGITATGSLPGMDGTNNATRFTVPSGSYSSYWFGTFTAFPAVFSYYQKRATSDASYQGTMYDGVNVTSAGSTTDAPADFTRVAIRSGKASGGAANGSCVPIDGRGYAVNAELHDLIIELPQVESNAAFASSPIRTATTRGADVLSFAVGQYPESFLTAGFRFDYAPICTTAELIAGGAGHALITFGTSGGGFHMSYTGGSGSLVVEKTSTVYTTVATGITFNANQKLTITVEPSAGRITLEGATTGNGTFYTSAWSYPSQTMYVGSYYGGASSPSFGRFGQYISAV